MCAIDVEGKTFRHAAMGELSGRAVWASPGHHSPMVGLFTIAYYREQSRVYLYKRISSETFNGTCGESEYLANVYSDLGFPGGFRANLFCYCYLVFFVFFLKTKNNLK